VPSETSTIVSIQAKRSRPETWLSAVTALILRVAGAVVVCYVLYRVGFIIVVVLMSVMLALSVAPLVDALCRSRALRPLPKPLRKSLATGVVFVALALALLALGVLVLKPFAAEVANFAAKWPEYQAKLAAHAASLQAQYNALPADIRRWVEDQEFRTLGGGVAEQTHHIIRRTLESGMLLVELILIPVLAFSFLTEGRPLKRDLLTIVPRSRVRDVLYVLRQVGVILQSYAIGQLLLALIAGIVVWLLMVALAIPYPLALAVVAAVTRVIPVVGPLFGGIPIVLFSALQGWETGLMVLIAFTVMHLVESKVVMPKVIGYRINLHPAIVIIVLLIGAEFFGMWGMFLAAPVAAIIRVLFHHFFVRPRTQSPRTPRAPLTPTAPVTQKEVEVERPAVAGVGSHSRAH
jgi:predicted PurR-regulated permease PerM